MTPTKFAKIQQLAISRGARLVTPKGEPGKMALVGYCASWIRERRD